MSSRKAFLILKSSDGETFEVDEAVACVSETINNMINNGCVDGVIPLLNVSSKILPKVIEYCKKNVRGNWSSKKTIKGEKGKEVLRDDDGEDKRGNVTVEELKKWEADFMDIDQEELYDLMLAANYLDIKGLLDLTLDKAASMIKGRTPDQIREIFNIKNDFTPEVEEEIQKENAWAFI